MKIFANFFLSSFQDFSPNHIGRENHNLQILRWNYFVAFLTICFFFFFFFLSSDQQQQYFDVWVRNFYFQLLNIISFCTAYWWSMKPLNIFLCFLFHFSKWSILRIMKVSVNCMILSVGSDSRRDYSIHKFWIPLFSKKIKAWRKNRSEKIYSKKKLQYIYIISARLRYKILI